MSQLEVDKIIPQSGTTLTIGDSGDTVNFADGTNLSIDTNTLYIDSTNNRVGIANASPSVALDVTGAAKVSGDLTVDTDTLRVISGTDNVEINGYLTVNGSGVDINTTVYPNNINMQDSRAISFGTDSDFELLHSLFGDDILKLNLKASDNHFTIYDNLTELVRFTGTGRVGIGTTSPITPLNVIGGSDLGIEVSDTSSGGNGVITIKGNATNGGSYLQFGDTDDDNVGRVYYTHNDNAMKFNTADAERMRIDSSGNLLVGTTSSSLNSVGFRAFSGGNGIFTKDDAQALILNRQTSDGDILKLYKDGTTVGTISAINGDLTIQSTTSGHEGLRFGNGAIVPVNTTGASTDNECTLGGATGRFADLYLAGGVYLGGTGTANKLDDYEEGTWTPSLNSGTASVFYATYTKIGNQCTLHFYLHQFSDTNTQTDIVISGVPFTTDTDGTLVAGIGSAYGERFDYNARTVVVSGTTIRIRDGLGVSNFSDALQYVDCNNGSDAALQGTVTYQTT